MSPLVEMPKHASEATSNAFKSAAVHYDSKSNVAQGTSVSQDLLPPVVETYSLLGNPDQGL